MNDNKTKKIILISIGIISVLTSIMTVDDMTKSILVYFQEAADVVPFFVPVLYFLNFVQISVYIFGILALTLYLILIKLNKEKK